VHWLQTAATVNFRIAVVPVALSLVRDLEVNDAYEKFWYRQATEAG
jgi:hypothetical protein